MIDVLSGSGFPLTLEPLEESQARMTIRAFSML
jgi:hypothetical protein